MSKRSDVELLADIQEAIHRIRTYASNMTSTQFLADTKTQDAVIRNLEIIGEATKKLSAEVREKYPEIPWKNMAGLRDRLIHHYFGVNLDIVWNIITIELPALEAQIEAIGQQKDNR